ncbi:hypothetical protein BGW36DRAFT_431421 [Talaromyces proteolyticus]|uniref:NTF2-like protein n=1 Tax=Talaromyces proteolyticus TaxID=1131652 RepID=A0AAD4KJ30_9EURO|nr:uncharacterized protein BGW36DRAFT_431421 [Talaromyces proteolyticus]KAH8692199.1 hypothetical protein BGW36DRAFT_431421 [Talaromyces proteolyticus]
MSLRAVYEQFLANPSPAILGRDVSLNYITTTTSVDGADEVLGHLQRQQKIVKKKADKVLDAIEAPGSVVLEIETTVEFVSGGGAYLPSLDDNFLADRVVTFPTVHIVRFDAKNQIQQIRLYWDQGSLLKEVEVIGSRGRNWPIRDAKDQSKLIANIVSVQGPAPAAIPEKSASKPVQDVPRSVSPSKKHIKDPHASLSLFGGNIDEESTSMVAPYAPSSIRPHARGPSEVLIGGVDDDATPTKPRDSVISPRAGASKHYGPIRVFGDDPEDSTPASPIQARIGSSRNFQAIRVIGNEDHDQRSEDVIQPKIGSNKNYQPVRLFGDDANAEIEEEPRYKTHPKKFTHFEMGEANDGSAEIQDRPAPKMRPMSQWDFADFATPEKPRGKLRAQDVRHFGWSDNEEEVGETPPARPRVVQPRRDAETHFDMADEDSKAGGESGRIIGSFHNKGLGLYENNLYDEEGNPTPPKTSGSKQPLSIVPNNAFRKKDFDSHWDATDASPTNESVKSETKPMGADRVQAVRQMDASWDSYDQSPEPKKAATPPQLTQSRANRKAFQPSWGFGNDDE